MSAFTLLLVSLELRFSRNISTSRLISPISVRVTEARILEEVLRGRRGQGYTLWRYGAVVNREARIF